MQHNGKLAHTLLGKSITSAVYEGGRRNVILSDGSTLSITATGGPLALNPPHAELGASPIADVWEAGSTLRLGLQNGTTIDFPLREEGAAVLARDPAGKVIYAG